MILTGVPSGDYECWCFLVTAEDYRRVTGRDEKGWEGRWPVGEYKYALYPSDLIKVEDGKVTTICVEFDITLPKAQASS